MSELAGWSEEWVQLGDSCKEGDQFLRLDAIDAGGGPYLVISTERWAVDFDNLDGFLAMLQSFAARGGARDAR